MIRGGSPHLEQLQSAIGMQRRLTQHIREKFMRDMARATAGDEKSARLDQTEGKPIQAVIAPQGGIDPLSIPSQFRGVEHHGVKFFAS